MTKILKSKLFCMPFLFGLLILSSTECDRYSDSMRIGVFEVNVTPPIGSPVAYEKARSIQDSLKAKGIVILSDEKPIVLCAVDWLGIANEGQDIWRESLAKAAGTTVNRVSVHTVHQHDGCRCDFTTEKILEKNGFAGWKNDTLFLRKTIQSVAIAVQKAKQEAQPVTHLGFGEAKVDSVASNRRILGTDGMVKIVRYSSTEDSAAIAAPEGLIDPWLKCVSFWKNDLPIVILNYYATHPMSHYRKGDVSSDFVGIARDAIQDQVGVSTIYFSGAGGNIAAGKYNDGSPENRPVLARRMEKAMLQAWEQTKKITASKSDVEWQNTEIMLPLGEHLVEEELTALLASEDTDSLTKFTSAKHLAWLRRTNSGHRVNISALRLANVWLLNLPGEAFVEFQLAAQKMKSGDFVCTAAYEEYGPGYLCTEIAYSQGGYESSNRASCVSPEIEKTLLTAIGQVLKSDSLSGDESTP
jgi:hypothetical protein